MRFVNEQCTDHLGNVYESKQARAKAYGLNSILISTRLYKGWSLEKALTTKVFTADEKLKLARKMLAKKHKKQYT